MNVTPFVRFLAWMSILFVLMLSCQKATKNDTWIIEAPAQDAYCEINISGTTIIPNGRMITPRGKTLRIAPHPYGLTLSPDGNIAITANSGNRPFSLSILEDILGETRVRQIPEGVANDDNLLGAVFMGLAVTPDNTSVYAAGGEENRIYQFDLQTGDKIREIACQSITETASYQHGYIGDLVLNQAGTRLFAVDQIGFRLIIIDTKTGEILHNVPTGRYPFGITLSPDETRAYVANVGVFEYQPMFDWDDPDIKDQALAFPPFGYNTAEMREGIQNDSVNVPGLGDPNVPESFSVWTIALEDSPFVAAKIKTGILVGAEVEGIPAVGGASPNSVVATDQYVFVSNGNNDCISVIDIQQDTVIQNLFLSPDERLTSYRGMIPFGLALSPDQQRLYVAESGINAVGVIDIASLTVLGHIPTGWFPSKLEVHPDGKHLIVANAKGYGSGPNGGPDFEMGPEGSYVGNLMKGSVSIMEIPTDAQLQETTQQVLDNNFLFTKSNDSKFDNRRTNPIPLSPGAKATSIKHIVFISKENRTYDEVFGQVKKGQGEPTMARYGKNQSFSNRAGTDSVQNCDVMVNHLALARRFAIADNFYVDADHSADGHRWLVNTYPNEWVETSVSAAYGGKRGMRRDSDAPGNYAFVGSTGAIYPEDYNEHGSIWDHFARNDISFFNFGFGTEMAGNINDSTMKYTGVKYVVNFPLPGPLFDHSSRVYPTYNMAIPDQFRADQFIQEFEDKFLGTDKTMPQVLTVLLPNDHGAGDRPHVGYPFKESYMMDNDLALGRIVEFLSHTPYWENMAIFVTMDDAQDGRDHIDAHRSVLMVISPWAKKDYVGHMHYSFGSIFKTFWNILGIPHLNQYDAGATDLADLFTDEPDYTPYYAYPVDKRAFDPQKVLDPFDEEFDWEAVLESPDLDDPEFLRKEVEAADKRLQEQNPN